MGGQGRGTGVDGGSGWMGRGGRGGPGGRVASGPNHAVVGPCHGRARTPNEAARRTPRMREVVVARARGGGARVRRRPGSEHAKGSGDERQGSEHAVTRAALTAIERGNADMGCAGGTDLFPPLEGLWVPLGPVRDDGRGALSSHMYATLAWL